MQVSRRKLLQVALPAAAASSELAAQAPATADAELEGARQYLRVGAQVTRQVPLSMAVEPATRFVPRS